MNRPPTRTLILLLIVSGCQPCPLAFNMKPWNGSGQSGTAILTQEGWDQSWLDVVVLDVGLPGPQVVHFHEGTCGTDGPIAFPPSGSPQRPLRSLAPEDGGLARSYTYIDGLWISDVKGRGYYVDVHEGTTAGTPVTSCGNVE